jgi:CBS domain-containing protein
MHIRTAAEVVADVVAREEFRDTPHTIQEVADYSLQMRVRAELEFNSPFPGEQIEVSANRGTVVLRGPGYETRRHEVAEFVGKVRGVTTVNPDDKLLQGTVGAPARPAEAEQTARDVMLPPDRYPTVHKWVTVRDAIVALSASSLRLEEDHFVHPRYILVLDEADRLAGIVSRRELLRGLTPQYRDAKLAEEHIRAMVGFGGGADELVNWTSLFSSAAVKAAGQPVSSVMAEVKGIVAPNTPLSEVVTKMIRDRVDLAPVVEEGKIIGIVIMTNIFDIVAEFIMEHGGRAP